MLTVGDMQVTLVQFVEIHHGSESKIIMFFCQRMGQFQCYGNHQHYPKAVTTPDTAEDVLSV